MRAETIRKDHVFGYCQSTKLTADHKLMKAKLPLLVLAGIVAFRIAGFAQDPAPAASDAPKPTAAEPAAAEPAAADPSPVVGAAPKPVTDEPAGATGDALMDVIIDDQPLTDAIKILARRASLNILTDPKVAFGVPGADGKIAPPPNVSIRWEKVTPRQALEALLANYGLQLVEDTKTRIARITTKDPAAPDPLLTKIIQLKYASPSNILSGVQTALVDKRSKVVPEPRTSQLVVVATEKELVAVEELVLRLDTPTRQVLIEAKILETTLNPKTSKGIDWSGTLANQRVSFGNGTTKGLTTTTLPGTPTTTTLPGGRTITTTPSSTTQTTLETVLGNGGLSLNTLNGFSPSTAFLDADGLSATLSFLNTSDDTKTISEPRMVTLDNQKAVIDVGMMYPIVNVSASTANTTGGSQISYTNLTVSLDVTPRVTANEQVELKVGQAILRLGPTVISKVGGVDNAVNSFFTRKVETSVLIPSGNTLVMGGLISDESITGNTKVPVLGDIPGLGLLFRKDSKERNRQNMIIFITPTIVKDTDFQVAKSGFLKSTGKETMNEEWSAWDSGKPRDWSDPNGGTKKEPVFAEVPAAPPTDANSRTQLPPN